MSDKSISLKKQRTLLLVDDEDNIRSSLKRALRHDGYTIIQADSGSQGLKILESNPTIGVILSDQRMPRMTGIEFLARACELRPDTVRMVLSGYTDLKTVTEAINQGAIYKFLTKPWEDELLRDNVAEAFEHYELRFESQRLTQELQMINTKQKQWIEKKTHEALINMHALQISQEVLECLPVAVLGIDEDGLLVVTNQQADALLSNSLLGQTFKEALPDALIEQIEYAMEDKAPAAINLQLNNTLLQIQCKHLEQTSLAKGIIVVMVPIKEH